MTIQGWSPKTTFLLHRICESNCGGYDIIDHAFGADFPSKLLDELKSNGWIDKSTTTTASGIHKSNAKSLKPARTKMDVDIDNLLQSFVDNPFIDNADSGATLLNGSSSTSTRGDESAFISRGERMVDTFPQRYPLLHRLIKGIENTARDRLGASASSTVDHTYKRLNDDSDGASDNRNEMTYFKFDTSLTSVQIAKYPGNGHAGYPRHCDRGEECSKELNEQNTSQITPERLLTFVYYLTPNDWDLRLDGGALRMFSPMEQRHDSNNGGAGDYEYFDVMPCADRLVVFRSDVMEHQVLPSLRRDRMAITVWLYGRRVVVADTEHTTNLPSRLLSLGDTAQNNIHIENGKDCVKSGDLPPPLPISIQDEPTKMTSTKQTIFVAIPSYRDVETWPTIKSLIERAYHPGRVYIGVVFQVATESRQEVHSLTTVDGSGVSLEKFPWSQETNFRSITMDYRHATGPCYARHLCQTLHRGEDYVLQIDSHMRFRPNWDEYLIQQLSKTDNPDKSMLTTYPPGYDKTNEPGPNAETRATILVPWKFGHDGMLRQKGRLVIRPDYQHNNSNEERNIPCLLYAGGFNFFHSSLLDICPYDSNLHGLFFGEEISMAIRLYTHGFDLYAPPHNVCYHLWERNPLRFRDDGDSGVIQQKMRKKALEIVRMQLRGEGKDIGTVRSVQQFTQELRVDFDKQEVLFSGCENAGLGNDTFVSPVSLEGTDATSDNDMSSVFRLIGQFINNT